MTRGLIMVAKTHDNPTTLAEVAHNLTLLATVKEQWTQVRRAHGARECMHAGK
jgi:hypothetical protein